jgi:nuclear transport factor 2 (NTF2) superfamily protein
VKLKPIYDIKEEIIPYNERYKEREKMIKEGKKTPYDIEEFLCKKYNINIELSLLKELIELHHDIIRVFSNKRGRPPLPSYLKKEGIEKNREKMREKMRNTYDFIKELNNKLLTDEEYFFLIDNIKGNNSLINKLSFFRNKSNLT